MKAASVQLLAELILVTQTQSVLVNCLEVYSCIPSFNVHTEKEEPQPCKHHPKNVFSQYSRP